jgi:hypothetical protein
MSRSKLIAFIALITLAFAVTLIGDALAGEYVKIRSIKHMVKFDQINLGDEGGHAVALYESKGIVTNRAGKGLFDGWLLHEMGIFDFNAKTGAGSWHGYTEYASREGDKVYISWEGTTQGPVKILGGTGKYQGIGGKGTWLEDPSTKTSDPTWFMTLWEGEMELPR